MMEYFTSVNIGLQDYHERFLVFGPAMIVGEVTCGWFASKPEYLHLKTERLFCSGFRYARFGVVFHLASLCCIFDSYSAKRLLSMITDLLFGVKSYRLVIKVCNSI